MAEDYIPILSTETDPNAPLRSSLFKRLVANPIAISEGAKDAPRIMPKALASNMLARLTGTGSTPVGINDLGGYSKLLIYPGGSGGTGAGLWQMSGSTDNGSTWGAWVGDGQPAGILYSSPFVVDLITGEITFLVWNGLTPTPLSAGSNALRFRRNSGATNFSASIFVLEGRADV